MNIPKSHVDYVGKYRLKNALDKAREVVGNRPTVSNAVDNDEPLLKSKISRIVKAERHRRVLQRAEAATINTLIKKIEAKLEKLSIPK